MRDDGVLPVSKVFEQEEVRSCCICLHGCRDVGGYQCIIGNMWRRDGGVFDVHIWLDPGSKGVLGTEKS